ncbi:AraC family transcriptional regulator [Comamonas humi]
MMPKRQAEPAAAPPPAIDVFSEIYARAQVRGRVSQARSVGRLQPLHFDEGGACIHIVQRGACRLLLGGRQDGLRLLAGDVVTVMQARPHRLEWLEQGGHDDDAQVITAVLQLGGLHGEALVGGLPELLHVPGNGHGDSDGAPGPAGAWIPTTIAAMELEFQSPAVGSGIMLSKTAELLFVWTIRHYIASGHDLQGGWAAALRDPAINRVLSRLHAAPGHGWDVEELARLAGQSRSNFSQRFIHVVGETPMRYLTRWRMQLAADLLASSNLQIVQVAEQAGYSSQAAFGRAFQRHYGVSPSAYRMQRP